MYEITHIRFGSENPCRGKEPGIVRFTSAGGGELSEQPTCLTVDLVANGADLFECLARRFRQLPVEIAPAGVNRAGVAAPMVITTSAALAASSVSGLGNALVTSRLISARASTTAGLTRSAGWEPAERTWTRFWA